MSIRSTPSSTPDLGGPFDIAEESDNMVDSNLSTDALFKQKMKTLVELNDTYPKISSKESQLKVKIYELVDKHAETHYAIFQSRIEESDVKYNSQLEQVVQRIKRAIYPFIYKKQIDDKYDPNSKKPAILSPVRHSSVDSENMQTTLTEEEAEQRSEIKNRKGKQRDEIQMEQSSGQASARQDLEKGMTKNQASSNTSSKRIPIILNKILEKDLKSEESFEQLKMLIECVDPQEVTKTGKVPTFDKMMTITDCLSQLSGMQGDCKGSIQHDLLILAKDEAREISKNSFAEKEFRTLMKDNLHKVNPALKDIIERIEYQASSWKRKYWHHFVNTMTDNKKSGVTYFATALVGILGGSGLQIVLADDKTKVAITLCIILAPMLVYPAMNSGILASRDTPLNP